MQAWDYTVRATEWPHKLLEDNREYPVRAYDVKDAVEQVKIRWQADHPGIVAPDALRILSVEPSNDTDRAEVALPVIHTRFDFGHPTRVMLVRCDLLQVPDVGQTVNIGGNPYVVVKVGWSLPDGDMDDYPQYAYVNVLKAGNFPLRLGGRDY